MDSEIKKATLLLKSLIFHYHGLDDDETDILKKAAKKLHGEEELDWANNFIAQDYLSAYERSKDYFEKTICRLDKSTQLRLLIEVWEDNHKKGYVTEMETTAMIKLSKEWQIDREFIKEINH